MAKWHSANIVKLGVAAAGCGRVQCVTSGWRQSWLLQSASCWHDISIAGLAATAEYMKVYNGPARHDARG